MHQPYTIKYSVLIGYLLFIYFLLIVLGFQITQGIWLVALYTFGS